MLKKSKKSSLHRGELLKKVAAESNLSISNIVSRMGYSSRNTFYGHLKKSDLSLALLKRYGRVLRYDFSTDIEELGDFKFGEEEPAYLKAPSNLEDATSQRDFYHRLYMELLEEKRRLEEENAALKKGIDSKGLKKK